MSRVRVSGSGIRLDLTDAERSVLGEVAGGVAELVGAEGNVITLDPALRRLLPDAYRDDPEASAEFRRFTESDLAKAKTEAARDVAVSVAMGRRVDLSIDRAERWMRSLTDMRLVLAERLDIRTDEDEAKPTAEPLGSIYRWLGSLQWQLVEALDKWDATRGR